VRASLKASGYTVHPFNLCASQFGVPQKRERFFLIGIRNDEASARLTEIELKAKVNEIRTTHLLGYGMQPDERVSVAAAISDLCANTHPVVQCSDSKKFFQPDYLGPTTDYQRQMREGLTCNTIDSARLAKHTPDVAQRFALIQQTCRAGAALTDADRERLGIRKHRTFLLDEAAPSYTLTTLPDDIVHYNEPRILTVRESARLQSFPDWFQFRGPYTTGGERRKVTCPRYTQVGNAVPVRLGMGIGGFMNEILNYR
jgi:DNA (cytosine-5)-methyltransferase 1